MEKEDKIEKEKEDQRRGGGIRMKVWWKDYYKKKNVKGQWQKCAKERVMRNWIKSNMRESGRVKLKAL